MATIIGKLYSVCQTLTEVSRYLAVVVCRRDDMFQRYGVNPNRGLRKPYYIFQVKAIVTDKLLGKLIHGHIAALVLILDELGNVLSHHFSGNECLTVGKSLVILGDLSLDVVERKIHLLGFLAFAYGSVALASQIALVTLCLQLNCAIVPLIVTRPMIGTIPFLSLLPFT